jgi:GT2 family glycosyltransferase
MNACRHIEAEVFVVDNHSSDGSREWLESKFPAVSFKWNTENIGFAKANNSVLDEIKGEQVLFLNPDTIVPEDCFEKCISFFRQHPDCGALGVKMIDGSGKFLKESKRSFPAPFTSFFKMAGLARVFPSSKIFAKYYAGHLPENDSNEVEVLAGAFLMMHKAAIKKVKGFDESFFMYGEDIDLSYRLKKAGFKNYYFAGTTIIHFKGESTQKRSRTYIDHFYGAMHLFVTKHYKEKKATYLFMHLAVYVSSAMSIFSLFIKKIVAGNPAPSPRAPNARDTVVVANQPYFDEMIQLIKFAKEPLVILGRVAVDNNDRGIALGRLEDIQEVITKNSAKKIVFCEGNGLDYINIIRSMQPGKKGIDFLFHAKNSDSIVGSGNRNAAGIFIAK